MAFETHRIEPVLEELKAIYNHPSRTYHNLSHIYGMLDRLEESRHLAQHPHRIEFAIWFHDAVYDVKASDNEIKSAELWVRKMALFLDDEPLQWGRRAILATIDHLPNDDQDIQLLLDVDLAPLGAPYEAFQATTNSLYEEYSRVGVHWYIFNKGRREFLGKLIKRANIFGTEFWYSRLEKQTRENIRRTLSA
ncbi:MAG: HD domain-containing protein [Promethearchaeota archaeon]